MSPISLSKYCFPMNHDRGKKFYWKEAKSPTHTLFPNTTWSKLVCTLHSLTCIFRYHVCEYLCKKKIDKKQKYLRHIVIADFGLYQLQTLPLAGMFGNPKLYSRNKKTTDLWTHKDTPLKPTPSLRDGSRLNAGSSCPGCLPPPPN